MNDSSENRGQWVVGSQDLFTIHCPLPTAHYPLPTTHFHLRSLGVRKTYSPSTTQEQISSFDQRRDLAVGDRAFVHPETTIGIDPFDAPFANDLHRLFDPLRHGFRRFDGVDLDVNHAQADAYARIEAVFEVLQLVVTARSHFEQNVIAMQAVDEADQFLPFAFLD